MLHMSTSTRMARYTGSHDDDLYIDDGDGVIKVFVGTSGWYYDWNEDRTLDWFIANAGLNSVELNASFYRFPFPNQVKSWSKKGVSLHWAVKVNRLITHRFKFSDRAREVWQRFQDLFSVMNELIDFFLFQLPPSITDRSKDKIAQFVTDAKIAGKCALEPRNDSWFTAENIAWARSVGLTWVSIDAPEFTRDIIKTTDNVYLRMHGRTDWYRHSYKTNELKAIAKRIKTARPKRVYVFFNNNHDMLKNAQNMHAIFGRMKD
jgi:uncharacterized protein YecE (DUF72 family)